MAVVNPPPISPSPPVPQRGDPTTFNIRTDAFLVWMANAVTEFSAVAANVSANATDAFNSATTATTKRNETSTFRDQALAYRDTTLGYRDAAAISASNAAAQAELAGTRATSAGSALGNAVLARDAAMEYRDQTQVLRNQTEQLKNEAQAIVAGDILGTAPDKFSNNAMLDVRFGEIEDQIDELSLPSIVSVTGVTMTATPGPEHVFQPGTTGAVLKLPATPPVGTGIWINDISLMRTNSIDPQGAKIRNASGVMLINMNNFQVTLRYSGVTLGWI